VIDEINPPKKTQLVSLGHISVRRISRAPTRVVLPVHQSSITLYKCLKSLKLILQIRKIYIYYVLKFQIQIRTKNIETKMTNHVMNSTHFRLGHEFGPLTQSMSYFFIFVSQDVTWLIYVMCTY
jgi:hypothetical protein